MNGSSLFKMQALNKPFDVSDYKDGVRKLRLTSSAGGLKTRSISMNDREEIRRRLAMDVDEEKTSVVVSNTRHIEGRRKSSHTTRLQNGMNLQCYEYENGNEPRAVDNRPRRLSTSASTFTNPQKTGLDNISSFGPTATSNTNLNMVNPRPLKSSAQRMHPANTPKNVTRQVASRPTTLFMSNPAPKKVEMRRASVVAKKSQEMRSLASIPKPSEKSDFKKYHLELHTQAKAALNQAKETARLQMQTERSTRRRSPMADLICDTFPFKSGKSRFSGTFLEVLGYSQLQILVNDLHSQIERLNGELVSSLVERDELHMEQDSILVDVHDLNDFLRSKE